MASSRTRACLDEGTPRHLLQDRPQPSTAHLPPGCMLHARDGLRPCGLALAGSPARRFASARAARAGLMARWPSRPPRNAGIISNRIRSRHSRQNHLSWYCNYHSRSDKTISAGIATITVGEARASCKLPIPARPGRGSRAPPPRACVPGSGYRVGDPGISPGSRSRGSRALALAPAAGGRAAKGGRLPYCDAFVTPGTRAGNQRGPKRYFQSWVASGFWT